MAAPVEAGGVIAILQSAGAAGIGLGGNIALGGCSSATASGFYYKFGNRKENKSEMDPQEKKKTLKWTAGNKGGIKKLVPQYKSLN